MEILCLDIGGTKLSGAISDEKGNLRSVSTNPLYVGQDAKRLVLDKIIEYADRVIDRNPDIERIGISVPGLTDSENGIWVFSPFSGIRDLNLRKLLGERYGLPVYAENDVNACALAEKRFGACVEEKNYMWVTITNGIGGSIIIDGKLFKGVNGNAGEIGHICVDEQGPVCGCGNKGCLEACASCHAMENAYLAMHPGEMKTTEELAAKAFIGDNELREMFYNAGVLVGKAAATAANLLDIGLFVFGGIVLTYDLMENGIKDGISRYAFKGTGLQIKSKKTGLGNQACLFGAATIALEGM